MYRFQEKQAWPVRKKRACLPIFPYFQYLFAILLLGPSGLVAATPDPEGRFRAVVERLERQDELVLNVGERLVVGGLAFCPSHGWSLGVTVQRLGQYGAAYRPAAAALLKLGDRPTIVAMASGSATASAGLKRGDQLLTADGRPFVVVEAQEGGTFAPTRAALDLLEEMSADGEVTLSVLRLDEQRTVMARPHAACRARFDVRTGRSQSASSDGTTVQVSTRLVDAARNEGELAAILAHELAHNILRHPQRLKARERGLSVRATEVQADRLSVYLLDAAGFDPAAAIAFWERWGRARDLGIFADGSHPGWRQRSATIRAEAAAIVAAHVAGRTIVAPPDLQPAY